MMDRVETTMKRDYDEERVPAQRGRRGGGATSMKSACAARMTRQRRDEARSRKRPGAKRTASRSSDGPGAESNDKPGAGLTAALQSAQRRPRQGAPGATPMARR